MVGRIELGSAGESSRAGFQGFQGSSRRVTVGAPPVKVVETGQRDRLAKSNLDQFLDLLA